MIYNNIEQIYKRIEEFRKARNISKIPFYKAIGMTTNGYLQMEKNNSIKLATLFKMAELFKVPIVAFFIEDWDVNTIGDDALDLDTALSLGQESVANILKQYEGMSTKQAINQMAKQIAMLKLQAEMATDLAQVRLEKINQLEAGQGEG